MRSHKGWALEPTGTDAGRTRPAARRRVGRIAGAAITALLAATMVPGFAAPASADVSANGVGPIAANSFPAWYSDGTTRLALCDNGPLNGCVRDLGGSGEAFWFHAAASGGKLEAYEAGLEAFIDLIRGSIAFSRLHFRMTGLNPGATYRIQHPYGVNTFIAQPGGGGRNINVVLESGNGGFASAGASFLGNYAAGVMPTFLTQSNRLGGQLGNIEVPGTVSGAPSGLNAVIVTGPNAGGAGINTLRVNAFAVQGRILGPQSPARAPNAPIIKLAKAGNASVTGSWTVPGNGGSALIKYHVRVVDAATGKKIFALRDIAATATSVNITGLPNGIAVRVQVQAINARGTGGKSNPSNAVVPSTVPSRPAIRLATAGFGSAVGNWVAPFNGGATITKYHVRVVDAANGKKIYALRDVAGTAPTLSVALPRGIAFRFQVQAINKKGISAVSAHSNAVTPR